MQYHLRADRVKCPYDSCEESGGRHDNLMRHIRRTHLQTLGPDDRDHIQDIIDKCAQALREKFEKASKSQTGTYAFLEKVFRWDNAAAARTLESDHALIDNDYYDGRGGCQPFIFHAIKHNKLDRVEQLIKLGAKVNVKDSFKQTPLHAACSSGFDRIIEILVGHGAEIGARCKWGTTPFSKALSSGHVSTMRLLISSGASIESHRYGSPFCAAASTGNLPLFHFFQEIETLRDLRSLSLDSPGYSGYSPLALAIKHGHAETTEYLLEQRAAFIIPSNYYSCYNSLIWASRLGHKDVVQVLLKRGVSVDGRDGYDLTALQNASRKGHSCVVKLLVDFGADISARDRAGRTELHDAADRGLSEVAKVLIDSGAKVNARDESGWTPLALATLKGHRDVVRHCCADESRRGRLIEDRNPQGRNALHAASARGHAEIVELLLDSGADVRIRDDYSWSPLETAAAEGHEKVVRILLDHHLRLGIDIGRALRQASIRGHDRVVSLLSLHRSEPCHRPDEEEM